MTYSKTSSLSLACALIFATALVSSGVARAECSLAIDALGARIDKANASQSSGDQKQGSISVNALEEKLKETTGDLKYGARGHDITENRLATAREGRVEETVPADQAAKSGVRHFNPDAGVAKPESSNPLVAAQSYWQQARELYAQGERDACSKAVEKGNAALDSREN